MYKSNHTKSKSDTDFHSNKIINDDISSSLKIFHNNIIKEYKVTHKQEKEGINSLSKASNIKQNEKDSQFISIFEKILLFKKQIDYYFFREKLPLIKFDLDNTLQIINKKIDDLKFKLISECQILEKSVLIIKLNEFTEVIKSIIGTMPQEFYKEIKLVILSQFERIRLEIFELLENLHENDNNENINLQDINKIKKECKFNHGILFSSMNEMDDDNEDDENDNSLKLTSELKENIISAILPRKNKILEFIEDITHDILFSLTKFSYIIDYYSLSVSNLNLHLFKTIISYVEKKSEYISNYKDNKELFLIELVFILNRTFTKKSLIDIKHKFNASESSIQNSMGKFILNNIYELIPKCQGLNNNIESINKQTFKSLFVHSYKHIFLKNYMKSYQANKELKLAKSYKFYYDLKLIFWKSVYTKMDASAKSPDICCRICEQNIPLNDFVLHVYYCKEQNHYYKKMNFFKSKMKKYINSLEIFKAKINQRLYNNENNFFKVNSEMNKIFKNIKLFNIDKDNSNDFLQTLIKIYINENSKPNDYYEKYPEKLYIVSTLIYLTFLCFIINKKKSSSNEDNEDNELSDILGNILSFLIQILFNTEYLLEARHSRTKSNRYLNNIHLSFHSASNDSFYSSNSRHYSSKKLIFNEFNVNKSNSISNINLEEEIKRKNSVKYQTIGMMTEDIKNKFSLNKTLLNQSKNNISQDESSLSLLSSNSNIAQFGNNKRRDSKSRTIKVASNFFETRSISENKFNEDFNFFFNEKKKNANTNTHIFINQLNNSNKIQRNFFDKSTHPQSTKILKDCKNLEIEKGPINIDYKDKKKRNDSSFDSDNNNFFENSISKEFFSQDKKNSNFDSFSGSNNNSDIDNNNIHNPGKIQFLSAKINNKFNKTSDKKVQSLFLKSDQLLSNYQPSLSYRYGFKKSLFQTKHSVNILDNNQKLLEKNGPKINHRSSSFVKKPSSEKSNKNENKLLNDQFEKINIEEKKRGISPAIKKKIIKKISIRDSQKNKNLIVIDNYESSEDNSENENNEEFKNAKKPSSINKNLNLVLNFKPKNEENNKNSNDSSNEEDNDVENDKDYFKNAIIERNDNENKLKNENQNYSSEDLSDSNKIIDEEQNWFNFDENFFMNSDFNSENINLVATIKELLSEIDNENDEDDDKEDNNENELENSKINLNLNSANKMSESNIKFQNFKLVLPLAKGGYGTVGLYKKTPTGDMYAIKIVNIHNMKEKKLSKTLQNERNILKGVTSDYVVNSYYIFKDKKNYYFVMEYLPGGDVYNLLSNIILPFSTIQLIIAETLLAVYYLHSINIIHHDIKPENILISKDGHFKLSDFGLSKCINEEEKKGNEKNNKSLSYSNDSSSLSSNKSNESDDNKAEGTLYYMAPELFTNQYPVGKPIDYWAIGIVIFELFTFKIPFEAETQEQTKKNIIDYNINWEPMHSEEVIKNYKNYIDCTIDLIKKFIFFNPEQRWGDKNFKEIQNHEFFKGFDWANIKKIKSTAVLSHLKKIVEKNNKKIKELNNAKGEKNNGDLICEVDLTYEESDLKFSQRIDNLQKRNNELIKMKFKKKEIKIEDDDKNFKNSLLFDLQ